MDYAQSEAALIIPINKVNEHDGDQPTDVVSDKAIILQWKGV